MMSYYHGYSRRVVKDHISTQERVKRSLVMVRKVRRRNKKRNKPGRYVTTIAIILYITHHFNVRNVANFVCTNEF